MSVKHRCIAVATGATAVLAVAVPALAASAPHETLSSYKISGASSAGHGKVTFHVSNTAKMEHEFVVIKTKTKAADLKVSKHEASEKGSVGEVEVPAGKSKKLSLNLSKGHYALICNFKGHYMKGMHKDFTVN